MTRAISVHLLPALFEPEAVRGGIAVIFDVLRASTTMVHALAHGAREIIPTYDIPTTNSIFETFAPGTALRGGERAGVRIEGFELDNNPLACTADVVTGKTIVFTTTNGTAAIHRSLPADRILIGAIVNCQAVVDLLEQDTWPIHLICAGTNGEVSMEDVLGAGAVATRLLERDLGGTLDASQDSLHLALDAFARHSRDEDSFRQAMRASRGGRNCIRLGFEAQIDRAGTFDMFSVVPEYDRASTSLKIRR